ncbi:response regulator transcription factor [Arsukibacterium indicum]|uniref:Response regulator n=1 Tax=Arsukibacterium indicum TaxID=2848612 RepID=A0ABS6MMB3_9GAMM|nr:response regulator [Arsukibacterium indicum]MBV2129437.1 response regulator [Arsukibacterium indicum]
MQAQHTYTSALLVDDTSSVRDYLRQILAQLGITTIYEAADGATADQLFAHYHPQLVFLDIQLPDINGKVLLKRFKQLDEQTKVFMVSAYSSVENLKDAIAGGAKAFVVKPFSAKRICNLVQSLQH